MKIKLDENMPESLAEQLGQLGHDVHTVPSEALAERVAEFRKVISL